MASLINFRQALKAVVCLFFLILFPRPFVAADAPVSQLPEAAPVFRQYCIGCHGNSPASAGINLEHLIAKGSIAVDFREWEKVVAMLEQGKMPQENLPQPSDSQRRELVLAIQTELSRFIVENAGDPGRVVLRRLSSAEYAYAIGDLTGLDLSLERELSGDAVGGEGFTNVGDVQFMQDGTLERYLDAAKIVASHAVIGAGPLKFFRDPGKSGFELSAIDRIREIHRTYGFRTGGSEGGKPFGVERYPKAFLAAWRYLHRAPLGRGDATLAEFAAEQGLPFRFVEHIWRVLTQPQPSPSYPTSLVVARWRELPVPGGAATLAAEKAARAGCEALYQFLYEWPRRVQRGVEVSALLHEKSLEAVTTHSFSLRVTWPAGASSSPVYFSATQLNPDSKEKPLVTWRNARIRYSREIRSYDEEQPLKAFLEGHGGRKPPFGTRPDGATIESSHFAISTGTSVVIDIPAQAGALEAELLIDADFDVEHAGDSVLRCAISNHEDVLRGRTAAALMADSKSAGYRAWKAGMLDFGRALPQFSHGEASPTDRDPIPAPFTFSAYAGPNNEVEHDQYITQLKYYRDDWFLSEYLLDESTRTRLDEAWSDLLGSFEYHDIFLRFVAGKYELDLGGRGIADLDDAWVRALPAKPRETVERLRAEYRSLKRAFDDAQPRHLDDALRFAARAWRRPLSEPEEQRLAAYYRGLGKDSGLDHTAATRDLIARILVAPGFLYRAERSGDRPGVTALTDWELASRLSYFLWSSTPDEKLRQAAESGELGDAQPLARQTLRMLKDDKARRMATEFFGQWFGFYRFDGYRGVDPKRFPEFDDELKAAMYEEAVSLFENIIREDRPAREILFADYTFLNPTLARHYGVNKEISPKKVAERVEGANEFHRGGLLRLGAVLTATSAPLRTSPVKRGDWILRRLLGTPVPPPPADAGSLPPDDRLLGKVTLRERLEAHQRDASCVSCHSRMDPLGFALERYDAIGRWRESYHGRHPIDDSGTLSDQTHISGVDGLLDYLRLNEEPFIRTFCNKLLAYALGRGILASDRPLIDDMAAAGGDARFSELVAKIVSSKQFRYRRGPEESGRDGPAERETNDGRD